MLEPIWPWGIGAGLGRLPQVPETAVVPVSLGILCSAEGATSSRQCGKEDEVASPLDRTFR